MASGTLNSPASGGEADGARRTGRSDYDPYILDRIQKTRRQVKRVELLTAGLAYAAVTLGYFLLFIVCDHWVIPGGLGMIGRAAAWVVFLGASISYLILRVLPIWLGRVNPIYAAMAIEQSQPSLKNSLVNFLLLRGHKEEIAPAIYKGIQQRAAADLSQVSVETAIDRSRVVRIAYVLLALVIIGCLYKLISPKDPLVSVGRLLAPWARWHSPTRVSIRELEPGNTQTFLDDSVRVSAFVRGLSGSDEVTLYYSTADGQIVDQPIPMQLPADKYRHEAVLPPGASGLQQSVEYFVRAGDATSPRYRIEVVSAPAILIERVEYDYPDYLGVANRIAERQGDLRAIEGTKITLTARTNVPIQGAYLDFACDGRRDLGMTVTERTATCSFTLALNAEGHAEHANYQLRITTEDGRENPQPIQHRIEVVPDQPPMVEIAAPEEDPSELAVNGVSAISIRAEDADFALRSVTLLAERQGEHLLKESLLSAPQAGEFRQSFVLDARELDLKVGDEVLYWAEARDVKQPQANVATTVKRRLRVAAAVAPEEQAQQKEAAEQQKEEFEEQTAEQPQASPDAAPVDDPTPAGPDANAGDSPGGAGDASNQGDTGAEDDAPTRIDPEANPGDAFEQIMKYQEERQQSGEESGDQRQQSQSPQEPSQSQQPKGETAGGDSAQDPSSEGDSSQQSDEESPGAEGEQGNSKGQKSDPKSGDSAGQEQQQPGGKKQQPKQSRAQAGTPDQEKDSGASEDSKNSDQKKADPKKSSAPDQTEPREQEKSGSAKSKPKPGDKSSGQPKQPNEGGSGEQSSGEQSGDAGEKPQSGSEAGSDDASGSEEQGGERGAGGSQPSADSDASAADQDSVSGSEPGGKESSKPEGGKPSDQQADDGGAGAGEGEAQPSDSKTAKSGKQGKQSPSGGDAERPNNSPGEGQSSGDQPSPSPAPQRQAKDRDKKSAGGQSPSEPMGESATSPSISQSDSDAQSSERGDRSGQGEEGGGQRASQPGKGAPGENSAAEEGSGESEGAGEGPTSSQGGSGPEKGQAQGDSKDQAEGAGREAESGGTSGGDQKNPAGGKPGSKDGQSDQSTGSGAGEGTGEAGSGEAGGEGNTPAGGSGQGATGDSQSEDAKTRNVKRPTGGGGERENETLESEGTSERADEANLDYARKSTDLVLDYLKDQTDRGAVDQALLDRLGWTEDDLSRFVRRWEELRKAARQDGPEGDEGQRKLDEALQGLGLRSGSRALEARDTKEAEALELQAGRRSSAPSEYAEQFRAYTQGTARGTKTPAPRRSPAPR